MTSFIDILGNTVRLSGTILMIGVLPGYVLNLLLFRENALEKLERIYLSVVASLTISSLVAVALARGQHGLSPLNMLAVLGGLTIIFAVLTLLRSHKFWHVEFARGASFRPSFSRIHRSTYARIASRFSSLTTMSSLGQRAAIASILIFLTLLTYQLNQIETAGSVSLTEFYISPDHLTVQGADYLLNDDEFTAALGIANYEGRQASYQINWATPESTQASPVTFDVDAIAVSQLDNRLIIDDDQSWVGFISIPAAEILDSDYVDLQLLMNGQPNPIASLRIWLPAG